MFDKILVRMRKHVRNRSYVMTLHADEERDADGLSVLDVENCILAGDIVERQRDSKTAEWKYRISGPSDSGLSMEVIAKIGPTGKLVIITVYLKETKR